MGISGQHVRIEERYEPANLARLNDWADADEMQVPCRSHDSELWFSDTPGEVEAAKELCRACPVRARCLDGALARREPWGVWGGHLFSHGAVIPRKPPRGRPRKSTIAGSARATSAGACRGAEAATIHS